MDMENIIIDRLGDVLEQLKKQDTLLKGIQASSLKPPLSSPQQTPDYSPVFSKISQHLRSINEKLDKMKTEVEPVKKEEKNPRIFFGIILFLVIALAGSFYYYTHQLEKMEIENDKARTHIIYDFVYRKQVGIDSIARSYGITREQIHQVELQRKQKRK